MLPYDSRYSQLVPMYNEPHRTYHNMTHIHKLLASWPIEDLSDRQGRFVADLIWFQDCYYDPNTPGTNQKISAQIADRILLGAQRSNRPGYMQILMHAIELTGRHTEDLDLYNEFQKFDGPVYGIPFIELLVATFLDMDIHTLGESNPDMYAWRSAQIRNEYPHLTHRDYCLGRRKFFDALLTRKKLFYTPHFSHLEAQARKNMLTEMVELDKSSSEGIRQHDPDTVIVFDETWTQVLACVATREDARRFSRIYAQAEVNDKVSKAQRADLHNQLLNIPKVSTPLIYRSI